MKKMALLLLLLTGGLFLFEPVTLALAQKIGAIQSPLPDLSIGEPVLIKNKYSPGEMVEVRALISHKGGSDLSGVKVRLLLDQKALGGDQVLNLKANGSREVKFSFRAESPGVHELSIRIDPENVLKEVDKGNNQATRRFEVTAPAAGSAAAVEKTRIPAGQTGGPLPPGTGPGVDRGPNPSKESPFPKALVKPGERQVVDTTPRVVGPPQPDTRPPRLNGIMIGDGAPETRNRSVTLKLFASGNPTHFCYKIAYEGHEENFRSWQPYQAGMTPSIELYEVPQAQVVSVQVKNDYGVSGIASARIQYVQMKDFIVDAAAIYNRCGNACTRNTRTDTGSSCGLSVESSSVAVRTGYQFSGDLNAPIVNPFGSKCEFVFFDGQRLKEGWEFAGATTGFTYKPSFASAVPQKLGHEILQSPVRGGRDLKFLVRVWADLGLYGEFRMQSLNIKGPWHKPISEAFE